MEAVTVGALHEHQVGGLEGEGLVQDRRVVLAQVTGEHQLATNARFLDPHLDARGTHDVPGLAHAHRETGERHEGRVVGDAPHLAHHGVDVRGLEQRRHTFVITREPAAGAFGFAHRELRGIAQQDGQQVGAGGVGVDRTPETARHQQRQPAAVVDVRVAQHHGVDRDGLERERVPVTGHRIGAALDHAAVQQQLAAAGPHDVAGAGHFARVTEKLQLHDWVIPYHPCIPVLELAMSDPVASQLDRRSFLIGGAVIGASLYVGIRLAQNRFDQGSGTGPVFKPNAFLRISPDDTVTVIIGKSEMGQGVYTGLAMAAAEELDVDPARVKVEFAPADAAFNVPFAPVQFTGGSMSTSTTYMPLREAGAKARAMLVAAAARQWKVTPESLRTENGRVFDGGKSLSYGALTDAASREPVPEKVALKDPSQFRYL